MPTPSCFRRKGNTLLVQVRVYPRSSRNEICGIANQQLRIKTTAAPADGRVNKAVAEMLAAAFGVAVSRITLCHGQKNRDKVFSIVGAEAIPDLPLL